MSEKTHVLFIHLLGLGGAPVPRRRDGTNVNCEDVFTDTALMSVRE